MIKNIIFDMYGVLIAEDPTCLMKAGFDEQTSNRLREVLYHSRWWNELDRGILPKEQIFRLIIEDTPEMEVVLQAIFWTEESKTKRCSAGSSQTQRTKT